MKTLNREPSSRHRTACATGTHHYSPVGRYLVGARGDPVGTVDPDGLDLQRPRVRSHNCIQHRLSQADRGEMATASAGRGGAVHRFAADGGHVVSDWCRA